MPKAIIAKIDRLNIRDTCFEISFIQYIRYQLIYIYMCINNISNPLSDDSPYPLIYLQIITL